MRDKRSIDDNTWGSEDKGEATPDIPGYQGPPRAATELYMVLPLHLVAGTVIMVCMARGMSLLKSTKIQISDRLQMEEGFQREHKTTTAAHAVPISRSAVFLLRVHNNI